MPLRLRPIGLGSGIDEDRPTDTFECGGGKSAASTRPATARQSGAARVEGVGVDDEAPEESR